MRQKATDKGKMNLIDLLGDKLIKISGIKNQYKKSFSLRFMLIK
jgi:hypothetical protein